VCVDDYITTERVAVVVRALTLGDKLTTADVARLVGISRQGAHIMLTKIARVTPLYEECGRWVMYMRGDEM